MRFLFSGIFHQCCQFSDFVARSGDFWQSAVGNTVFHFLSMLHNLRHVLCSEWIERQLADGVCGEPDDIVTDSHRVFTYVIRCDPFWTDFGQDKVRHGWWTTLWSPSWAYSEFLIGGANACPVKGDRFETPNTLLSPGFFGYVFPSNTASELSASITVYNYYLQNKLNNTRTAREYNSNALQPNTVIMSCIVKDN